MRRVFFVVALLSSLGVASADAQARDSLAAGTRVRLHLTPTESPAGGVADRQNLTGTITATSPDSLTIQFHPAVAPVSLGWSAVDRAYRSRGVPTRAQSAARAGLYGAASWAAMFFLLDRNQQDPVFSSNASAALWGGGLGAAFGAVVGARYPTERWKRLRLAR